MSFCYSSVRIYCQSQRVLAFLFGKPIRLFAHKEKGNLLFHNVVLNMIDQIKAVLLMVYSALSGFFLPIHDFIVAILILLGMNFVSGWIEDSLHADGWKWKKAFRTMLECCVLCGIGAFVFVIGHYMHQQNGALQCLTGIYAAAIWFYCINILNNWKKILIKDTTLYRFINFLHWLVSMKFVEKIPYLSEFINHEKDENN